jgi:RNA polymerase sigma-70 factor (ECF subfamily)
LVAPHPLDGSPVSGITDEALALRAAAGERSAFECLVERYGTRVRAVVERQLGDHHLALDLAQEVWIRAFKALPRFRSAKDGGRFRPWLFMITFNLIRDHQRSQGTRPEQALEDQLQMSPASERFDPSGRVEEIAAIDEALQAVPEPFGAALQLVDLIGLTYEEAARSLRCTLGTVKSRVHRGRLAFRDIYLKLSGDAPEPSLGATKETP